MAPSDTIQSIQIRKSDSALTSGEPGVSNPHRHDQQSEEPSDYRLGHSRLESGPGNTRR
jgi:hypothetical protein